jgi:hypothetical protein
MLDRHHDRRPRIFLICSILWLTMSSSITVYGGASQAIRIDQINQIRNLITWGAEQHGKVDGEK